MDEQHLAQTMLCGESFQALKLLGEAPDPAKPSLQVESVEQRVKPLVCFLSHLHTLDTKVTLRAGDSWPVQCWFTSLPQAQGLLQLSEPPWTSPGWGKPLPCLPPQQHPHTNLDLHRVFLGPVPIIFLLALHELPEMFLDQESSIEFAHCHLIIWREETNKMILPVRRSQVAGAVRPCPGAALSLLKCHLVPYLQ